MTRQPEKTIAYRLLDGSNRIVAVHESACRGASLITFTRDDGVVVDALIER